MGVQASFRDTHFWVRVGLKIVKYSMAVLEALSSPYHISACFSFAGKIDPENPQLKLLQWKDFVFPSSRMLLVFSSSIRYFCIGYFD